MGGPQVIPISGNLLGFYEGRSLRSGAVAHNTLTAGERRGDDAVGGRRVGLCRLTR
jgi:hypothetical protein